MSREVHEGLLFLSRGARNGRVRFGHWYDEFVNYLRVLGTKYVQSRGLWKVVDWDVHIVEESNRYCKSKKDLSGKDINI